MIILIQLDQEVVGICGIFSVFKMIMADYQRYWYDQPGVKPYLTHSHGVSQSSIQPS